jgi:hypothetical protein
MVNTVLPILPRAASQQRSLCYTTPEYAYSYASKSDHTKIRDAR